jgi:predicted NAD/FAD-binding protein
VDVYEAEDWFGGHARTVDLTVGDESFPADAGFMVFNQRTYPNLIRLFERLGVEHKESDMSFSVQIGDAEVEWSGTSLDTVFAQRRNIANPRFLRMLADVVRFSRDAERLLNDPSLESVTLGEMLEREGYSAGFTDWYLIPMGDAIWSTPPGKMLDYPAATFLHFCDNHGLLHITGKPTWMSVVGGSRSYIGKALASLSGEAFDAEPVERIERTATGARVHTSRRTQVYDAVVIATHPPQTLAVLGEAATVAERRVLSSFSFQPNAVAIHTDTSFMPAARRAWASWNWYADSGDAGKEALTLTYHLNNLQALPPGVPPVLETLNPHRPYADGAVLTRMVFDHPLFTAAAIAAQKEVAALQGVGGVWFAGAWQRFGFHEDGILSAVRVAEALGAEVPWGAELDASRTRPLEAPRPERDERSATPAMRPRTDGA